MWTTVPVLFRALTVMREWGFKYSSARVWVKLRRDADPQNVTPESLAIATAYEVRGCVELLLIGKIRKPERLGNPKPISVCFAKRREHSRKPDELRDEIARLFRGPRIELFARSRAPGWDAWGNETTKFDAADRIRQLELDLYNSPAMERAHRVIQSGTSEE
jgi:N6-adenosine-specific RNA methylase IME4